MRRVGFASGRTTAKMIQPLDVVWGGPNGQYSLAQARQNFEQKEQEWLRRQRSIDPGLASATPAELRGRMLSGFDAMLGGSQGSEAWNVISECRDTLDRLFSNKDRIGSPNSLK